MSFLKLLAAGLKRTDYNTEIYVGQQSTVYRNYTYYDTWNVTYYQTFYPGVGNVWTEYLVGSHQTQHLTDFPTSVPVYTYSPTWRFTPW